MRLLPLIVFKYNRIDFYYFLMNLSLVILKFIEKSTLMILFINSSINIRRKLISESLLTSDESIKFND